MRQVRWCVTLAVCAWCALASTQLLAVQPAEDPRTARVRELVVQGMDLTNDRNYAKALENARAAIELASGHDTLRMEHGSALLLLGRIYDETARPAEAVAALKKALELFAATLDIDTPLIASTTSRLRRVYQSQNDHAAAIALVRERHAALEQRFGSDSEPVALALGEVAEAYAAAGRSREAEAAYLEALDTLNAHPASAKSPGTLDLMGSLGQFYLRERRGKEATAILGKRATLTSQVFGDHAQTGRALSDAAEAYHAQGLYKDALGFAEFAVQSLRKEDERDPDVQRALETLADVHYALAEYAKVTPIRERLLKIARQAYGPTSETAILRLITLGAAQNSAGNAGAAARSFQEAIGLAETAVGTRSRVTAIAQFSLGDLLAATGHAPEARPFLEQALATGEQVMAPGDPQMPALIEGVANVNLHEGRTAEGEKLYERALAAKQALEGSDSPGIALTLNNWGELHRRGGNQEKALALHSRALAMREKWLGQHPLTAQSFLNVAAVHRQSRNFPTALDFQRRGLRMLEGRERVMPLIALGEIHGEMGERFQALVVFEEALQRARSDASETDARRLMLATEPKQAALYASAVEAGQPLIRQDVLNLAAFNLLRDGRIDDASSVAQSALAKENSSEPAGAYTEDTFTILGMIAAQRGNRQEAVAHAERHLSLRQQRLGARHVRTAESWQLLVVHLAGAGDLTRALDAARMAITLSQEGTTRMDALAAETYGLQARIQLLRMDYAAARNAAQRAVDLAGGPTGATPVAAAAHLIALSEVEAYRGDAREAARLAALASSIYGQANQPEPATLLRVRGKVELLQGHDAEARVLLDRAAALPAGNSPDRSALACDQARLALSQLEAGRAETLLTTEIAWVEKMYGTDHPLLFELLDTLAKARMQARKFDEAMQAAERAAGLVHADAGPDSARPGLVTLTIGSIDVARNEAARAGPVLERAKVLLQGTLGPDAIEVAMALRMLARTYTRDASWDASRRAVDILRARLGAGHRETRGALAEYVMPRLISVGPNPSTCAELYELMDMEKAAASRMAGARFSEQLLRENVARGQLILPLAINCLDKTPAASSAALLDFVLAHKGGAQAARRLQLGLLRGRQDADTRNALDRYVMDERSAAFYAKARQETNDDFLNAALYAIVRDEEHHELMRLENRLSREIAALNRDESAATSARIASRLPANHRFVEILRLADPVAGPNGARYGAFLVDKDRAARWIDLGPAREIERDIASLLASLAVVDNALFSRQLRARLYRTLIEPIAAKASPGGPAPTSIFVVPDGMLASLPWAALTDADDKRLPQSAIALHMIAAARDLPGVFDGRAVSANRDVIVAGPTYGRGGHATFKPLPGALDEGKTIGAMLPTAQIFTGADANHYAIQDLNAPRILHIATHGFYRFDNPGKTVTAPPAPPTPTLGTGDAIGQAPPTGRVIDGNAALAANGGFREPTWNTSGIALARANISPTGTLSSRELAIVNLHGTQLVVVSACNTALGEPSFADGLQGIQGALTIAGAHSQLLTLWQVSDRATQEFMVAFYRRLLGGATKSEALRLTQKEFIEASRPVHEWAGFVLFGDPGPLR